MKNFLAAVVSPLAKLIAFFHKPDSDVNTLEFVALKAMIKDGDVLVSRTNWSLSNIIMPGYWKHCAIYMNGHIYEAVTSGVRKTSLEEFFFKKDHVGLGRYSDALDSARLATATDVLESCLGEAYDWTFLGASKKYYCSELVFVALDELYPHLQFEHSTILGQSIVTPTDVWNNLIQIGRWE